MKIVTGKRVGQSGPELFSAVLFSFVLHVLIFTGAFILFGLSTPRTFVPPFYRVTLVGQPAGELPEVPPSPTTPAPAPAQEQKPQPQKPPKAASKPQKAAAKKGGMPELATKQKPATEKPVREEALTGEKPLGAGAGKPQGGVAVSTPLEPKFTPYVGIVREKIEMNWNPPPGAMDAKATVAFRISRSGRVTDTNLQSPSGNFYFDQAAMRAILLSSPFPPLPEAYFKDSMDFSVDLMPKE